jgi:hypothetical protein
LFCFAGSVLFSLHFVYYFCTIFVIHQKNWQRYHPLEKSHKNTIFIISGFNGGHRNDKMLSALPFMPVILMSDPLVYSQTTVQCRNNNGFHRFLAFHIYDVHYPAGCHASEVAFGRKRKLSLSTGSQEGEQCIL